MPARAGSEYIQRLRERHPEVYLRGERIADVTTQLNLMAPSAGRLALGPEHHRCPRHGPFKIPRFISEDSVVEDVKLATTAIKRLMEPEGEVGLACYLASEVAIR